MSEVKSFLLEATVTEPVASRAAFNAMRSAWALCPTTDMTHLDRMRWMAARVESALLSRPSAAIADAGDSVRDAGVDYRALYEELIYAVGRKWPGETRHKTALKYIRHAEEGSNEPAEAAKQEGA